MSHHCQHFNSFGLRYKSLTLLIAVRRKEVIMQIAVVIFITLLQSTCIIADAGSNHYNGNNFYLGAMKNYDGHSGKLWVTISTDQVSDDVNVSFTVETLRFTSIGNVSNTRPLSIELPSDLIVEEYSYLHRAKGIHVFTHNETQFISVVLFNYETGSVGDYTSIPCNPPVQSSPWIPIQTEYTYFSLSTSSPVHEPNLWSQMLLVGCQDNTLVTVKPSQELLIPIFLQESYSPAVTVYPGQEHSFVLNAGETLLLGKSNSDITGSEIISNHPLTVVSGHQCSNVPSDMPWCEHLAEQVPPTHTWGNEFLLAPFKGRKSGQYFKIIAKQDLTTVSVICNGTVTESIDINTKGGYSSFFLDSFSHCYVKSTKPILLVQFALGAQLDGIGDPIMVIQTPTQQYTTSVSLDVLNTEDFANSYVNIMTNGDASGVTYDGEPLADTVEWVAINDTVFNVVGYTCMLDVTPGAHRISHPTGRLSAFLYGFHKNPNRGYGHSLGSQLNLLDETLFVSFEKQEYWIRENHTSIVVGIYCRASFSANSSVIVKTIPSDSSDFKPLNQLVTCQQGESYKEITVSVVDDNLAEPTEQIILTLEALSEEFNSQNNKTIIHIIDDDSVDLGFVSEGKLLEENYQKALVSVGTLDNRLQDGTVVSFVVALDIINNGEYYTAMYHAGLSADVSIIQVEFNLTKVMDSILLTTADNYTITATLSAEESIVFVSMFNSSLNLFLSHPVLSTVIPQTSTDLTRETLAPSNHNSKFSSIAETTMTTYTCSSNVIISTVTIDRVIISNSQEVLSTSSSLDEPFSSMSVLIMSVTGGILIFMIIIITIVFFIILLRKTSNPNHPSIPGVTNPCQIPEIKGSFKFN